MTTFRSEEALVGIITFAAVPWIVWILRRGIRDKRLPVGKGQVRRDERPAAFHTLFALYVAAALVMAFIAVDLLLGLDPRLGS
jgi:uncharacterized membrane protein